MFAIRDLQALRAEFWQNVKVVGTGDALAPELERAGRVADFLDFGIMMCLDALTREESCGGHFRTEYQFFDNDPEVLAGDTQPGEAKRDDDHFSHVACWQYQGADQPPVLHKERLAFDDVHVSIRSYA